MKTAFALLLIAMLTASADEYPYPDRFAGGDQSTVTACSTTMYEAADETSAVLTDLPPGEMLKIHGFEGTTLITADGTWGWFEASATLDGTEYRGFVQDRDLALSWISLGESETATDTILTARLYAFDRKNHLFAGRASLIIDNAIVSSLEFNPSWINYSGREDKVFSFMITSSLLNPEGFTGVNRLVSLFSGEYACGILLQRDLIFVTDNNMIARGPQIQEISEAGLFSNTTEVILPSDSNGVADQLSLHIKGDQYIEESDSWEYFANRIETYLWTGEAISDEIIIEDRM